MSYALAEGRMPMMLAALQAEPVTIGALLESGLMRSIECEKTLEYSEMRIKSMDWDLELLTRGNHTFRHTGPHPLDPRFELALLRALAEAVPTHPTVTELALHLIGTRWMAGESLLLHQPHRPHDMLIYALDVVKVRWPEGEEYLLRGVADPSQFSLAYRNVAEHYRQVSIGGRWPELETARLVAAL